MYAMLFIRLQIRRASMANQYIEYATEPLVYNIMKMLTCHPKHLILLTFSGQNDISCKKHIGLGKTAAEIETDADSVEMIIKSL